MVPVRGDACGLPDDRVTNTSLTRSGGGAGAMHAALLVPRHPRSRRTLEADVNRKDPQQDGISMAQQTMADPAACNK